MLSMRSEAEEGQVRARRLQNPTYPKSRGHSRLDGTWNAFNS